MTPSASTSSVVGSERALSVGLLACHENRGIIREIGYKRVHAMQTEEVTANSIVGLLERNVRSKFYVVLVVGCLERERASSADFKATETFNWRMNPSGMLGYFLLT